MKTILTIAIANLLFLSCANDNNDSLKIIKSNIETIKYHIDGEYYPNWKINSKLKPDRLKVECDEKDVEVGFITDVDSIFFSIKERDTIQFNILLNQIDTAFTEIVGIPKNVNFSDEYISINQRKFNVKVPEVHELANVMVAISRIGQLDSNMVDMTTKYHKDVINHFSPYKNHPAIDAINNSITKVLDIDSYWYYYALKMNACGYLLNEENEIIDDGIIRKMGFDNRDDPFLKNKGLFEDFARLSNFREFYKSQEYYYESLIEIYKKLNPIDKMQNWLENKFKFRYGNYLVTFSPLVGGAHSTQKFEDNGFSQTVMFVCRSEFSNKNSRDIDEMINSRVVFTEIDHNFTNPISDKFLNLINKAFKFKEKWVNYDVSGTSAYNSPYAIFNEYITWAIYSMYCLDTFPVEHVNIFIPKMENQMVSSRGFVNFKDFNQKLISLYKNRPEITIEEIYLEMLNWSERE